MSPAAWRSTLGLSALLWDLGIVIGTAIWHGPAWVDSIALGLGGSGLR